MTSCRRHSPPRTAWLLTLALIFCLAASALARAPEPAEVPPGLPPAARQDLERRRGGLALQWERLVERVRVHNQHCQPMPPVSDQAQRCRVNLAAIRREIGEYVRAVDRFNLRVAAEEIKARQAPGKKP